jgi:malate/lactate dehydrogenase
VIGLPTLITTSGVTILDGYPMNEQEHEALQQSADIIRGMVDELASDTAMR